MVKQTPERTLIRAGNVSLIILDQMAREKTENSLFS